LTLDNFEIVCPVDIVVLQLPLSGPPFRFWRMGVLPF